MKISLYQRLALALAVLFIAVGGVFFWWSHNLEQLSRNEAEQRLHISLAKHLAADNPLLKQGVYDHQALKNLFHTLMLLGPSFEFYFVDSKGKILTYSAEPGKVKRDSIDLLPLFKLIRSRHCRFMVMTPVTRIVKKSFRPAPFTMKAISRDICM